MIDYLVDPLTFDADDYDEYIDSLIEENDEKLNLIERKYRS